MKKHKPRSHVKKKIGAAWMPDLHGYQAEVVDSVCNWMQERIAQHARQTGLDVEEATEVAAEELGW